MRVSLNNPVETWQGKYQTPVINEDRFAASNKLPTRIELSLSGGVGGALEL